MEEIYLSLFKAINRHIVLTKEEIELCKKHFEYVNFSSDTIIEESGHIPKTLYFVGSGCLRLFYIDDGGNEITTHFGLKDSFFATFLPFVNKSASSENLESVNSCELLRIARADLKTLIDRSENFKKFSLIIFEHAIASSQERANDLATMTAEQRYRKLIENQPMILQQVPIQYIASFLGIKPESLSRIRRKMIN